MAFRKMALAAAAAMLATLLLAGMSAWGGLQPAGARRDVAVFEPKAITHISSDNLVDALSGLPLSHPISRASWQYAELRIDLLAGRQASFLAAWQDMMLVLRLAFIQADNVNRLLIRFVEPYEGGAQSRSNADSRKRLLFAIDSRQEDSWLGRELLRLDEAELMAHEQWPVWLRLAVTAEGEARYGADFQQLTKH